MFYVYFAKSLRNHKIYVGYTSKEPKIRVSEHNNGNSKWSSENRPLKLIYYESYLCEEDALLREKFYKTGFGKRIKKNIVETLDP